MRATRSSLCRDLQSLGVQAGDLLMVHGSLRRVGDIVGGVNTVIHALLDTVGPQGTLAAYVDFESFCEDDDEEIPVFDKRVAHAARDHGILHEAMRTWPGALRSDHPDAGVVAIGPLAEYLTADHPFQYGYGPGSPFAKVFERRGRVLMIGAPLDTITMLHYAEHLANIPGKRVVRYRRRMPAPDGPTWVEFEEYDTAEPVHDALPSNCFELIALDYVSQRGTPQGLVGNAESFLFETQTLIPFAVHWLETAPL